MKLIKYFSRDGINYKIEAKVLNFAEPRIKVSIFKIDFGFLSTKVFNNTYIHQFMESAIEKCYNSYFNMESNLKNFNRQFNR